MKKIIIFLLLVLPISILEQEKKQGNSIFTEKILNSEIFFSYNDDIEDEDLEMDEEEADEEDNPYYWETYIEDDTVENDMNLYEDPIEDDTEKNMSDFRK